MGLAYPCHKQCGQNCGCLNSYCLLHGSRLRTGRLVFMLHISLRGETYVKILLLTSPHAQILDKLHLSSVDRHQPLFLLALKSLPIAEHQARFSALKTWSAPELDKYICRYVSMYVHIVCAVHLPRMHLDQCLGSNLRNVSVTCTKRKPCSISGIRTDCFTI